jgi:hypothetical protein
MNKPNYNLRDVEGRIASLEEDAWEAIQDGTIVPCAAIVVPEWRWLVDQLINKRKHDPKGSHPIEPALAEADLAVIQLERKFTRAARNGSPIARINASIIPDMRYVLDQLGVETSAKRESDAFEAAMASDLA